MTHSLCLDACREVDVIFSSLNAFGSIPGPILLEPYAVATSFTVGGSEDVVFDTLGVALRAHGDGRNRAAVLTLELRGDRGGEPGALLESFSIFTSELPALESVVSRGSLLNPLLSAGARYWVVAIPRRGFEAVWALSLSSMTRHLQQVVTDASPSWFETPGPLSRRGLAIAVARRRVRR